MNSAVVSLALSFELYHRQRGGNHFVDQQVHLRSALGDARGTSRRRGARGVRAGRGGRGAGAGRGRGQAGRAGQSAGRGCSVRARRVRHQPGCAELCACKYPPPAAEGGSGDRRGRPATVSSLEGGQQLFIRCPPPAVGDSHPSSARAGRSSAVSKRCVARASYRAHGARHPACPAQRWFRGTASLGSLGVRATGSARRGVCRSHPGVPPAAR